MGFLWMIILEVPYFEIIQINQNCKQKPSLPCIALCQYMLYNPILMDGFYII